MTPAGEPAPPPSPVLEPPLVFARLEDMAENRQFSLRGLMALMVAACVTLALGRLIPPAVFAFILGAATLISLVGISMLRLLSGVVHMLWWGLFGLYLLGSY
ncbi:MAG: hypothetical protein N2C14_33630, partial [Planctomycetales bacterium]